MYLHPDLAIYATDRFVLACIALFLEAVIGRMSWLFRIIPHPFAILRSSAAFLGRRLNRSRRGPKALIVRGAIVTGFLCCATGSVGWMISKLGGDISGRMGGGPNVFGLFCLAAWQLFRRVAHCACAEQERPCGRTESVGWLS